MPQTEYGYISSYSKVNAQENFAEHFWAYVRDREAFLVRAREEQARGHPELMRKYRFMETLVDHTPTTMQRLSTEFILNRRSQLRAEDRERQREAYAEYRLRWAQKDSVVAAVQKKFGKPFRDLTREDYARFMDGLDLNRDDDLWTWSHVTGIPIVGLNQRSTFFYCNAHLLEDIDAAVDMPIREVRQAQKGVRRGARPADAPHGRWGPVASPRASTGYDATGDQYGAFLARRRLRRTPDRSRSTRTLPRQARHDHESAAHYEGASCAASVGGEGLSRQSDLPDDSAGEKLRHRHADQ